MQVKRIKSALVACLLFVTGFFAFADKTPVENLYQYTLDNGLTLFVNENHSVPLAYIEIAVRAGATTQTPETAGLFHLYEHMMFKGNELYPDAASVQNAIQDLGVASWNGTTGVDHVNYFFTIPSYELERGLAFWNAAVRTPLMDKDEFENEKKVVLAEIEGSAADPSSLYRDYVFLNLFPNAPYRTDAGGSFTAVRNATVEQMYAMQARYYIPANSALFVGGDVNPEEVYKLVNKIYGDWSNNGNAAPLPPPQQDVNPIKEVKYAVMPYEQLSPYMAILDVMWRGPDADFAVNDTYAADYLVNLLADPEGTFKTSMVQNPMLGIPDVDYVSGSYGTSRASGYYAFEGIILSPEQAITERADAFVDQIRTSLNDIAQDRNLYSRAKVNSIVQQLKDSDIRVAETAEGLLSNLRFWWVSTSPEYYYNYNKNIGKVTQRDVQSHVEKYFGGTQEPLVLVMVNPAIYEATKAEFAAKGYDVVTEMDCTWWKLDQFAPNPANIAKASAPVKTAPIYHPQERGTSSKETTSAKIDTYYLANGIPVYVQKQSGAKVDSVYIGVRGGVEHLTVETSGLEQALFTMMAKSSTGYSLADRQALSFTTGSAINVWSKMSGSAIGLNVLDSYLDKMLPAFIDGFINPDFDASVYENLMTDYMQSLQTMMNDPSSLLDYEMTNAIYSGHPYEVRPNVTPDSYEQITIENMQNLHTQLLANTNEIVVVAAGNVDGRRLVRELNKTLGRLPKSSAEKYVPAEVPPVTIPGGEPVVLTHPYAAGTGFVSRVFASPANSAPDYIAAALAGDVYSDILFNVVRERHGACYTPYSYVSGSRAPIGMEYLYRLSDFENFATYLAEARDYMLNNQIIKGLNEDGSYNFVSLEDTLESYINSYITSTYASLAHVDDVAGEILYNLLQFDDLEHDAKVMETVKNITTQEILDAFRKYWIDGESQWFVITGPEDAGYLQF